VHDGLSTGGVSYTGEFGSTGIQWEVEDDHRALRKKTSGSHDATQATSSTLICNFRCLDGNLYLDETA
jgi:hypothetical protein